MRGRFQLVNGQVRIRGANDRRLPRKPPGKLNAVNQERAGDTHQQDIEAQGDSDPQVNLEKELAQSGGLGTERQWILTL